ncbi:TRAP transporter fused permease subunit [Aliihoeflea aestuarii]|jgi:TRAP transporter 4TM/12TM fusion protein|uniref:TRAP transporter permease n=1 Tax=Aliihoeflea aestuarii TaxID=453840 RepID=UPI002092D10E|nr:TRAP transporter permease [Aliihoeflea aestuarii]MCO6391047.1 TRAP transporter fused permease subunit [Aliihoeflea aestuarii]
MSASTNDTPRSDELAQMVAEADTGGRTPTDRFSRFVLLAVPLCWALFQIWYASPWPYQLRIGVFNATEARAIHLAFGVFLAFVAYPAFKGSPRNHIPLIDWALALGAAFCAAYLFLYQAELARRPGLPTTMDLTVAVLGILFLLEGARRTLGLALPIVGLFFIAYAFFGPYLPGLLAHRGASLSRAASQYWLTTEGVFGVALGVSTAFVFLFVLFGSLLERAGAGNYFIKLAFGLLGHLRGGPAKAAVLGSASTGLISGSSVANVVTTGTFTIPLMKRVGYPPVKAGAIEVSASVNGQIMPPVMGAAAFLIAEYVGISYAEVVRHAIVPALLTYLSLFYVVDIEARKYGMKGVRQERRRSRLTSLAIGGMTISGFILFCGFVYYALGWTRTAFGSYASWAAGLGALAVYIGSIAWRARYPDLEADDPAALADKLPDAVEVAPAGIHYVMPVFILVWCLMVEELSPGLSAFYGTMALIFLVATQRPLIAFFRRDFNLIAPLKAGFVDVVEGLATGARNMVGIAIATAAAGIVVGTVALTGIGLVLSEIVIAASGGNLLIMLLMTALICMVVGLGMPTTANYVVVATLMAPVIVEVATLNGLAVALVAVHLYVFYFGLMADVTPPVGLASFAASAISRADPLRTGIQAFRYEMRTAILPLVFIFNHQLLLIGIESWWHLIIVVTGALVGMLMFVSVTQQIFVTRSRIWESAILLLACFMLFRPGFFMDRLSDPYIDEPGDRIVELAGELPADAFLRFEVEGMDLSGNDFTRIVQLPLGDADPGAERLAASGVQITAFGGQTQIVNVRFRSQAERLGLEVGQTVTRVEIPDPQTWRNEWMFIPALALVGFVAALQWRRREWDQPGMPVAKPA